MRGPWEFEEPLCAEVGGDFWFPERHQRNDSNTKFAKSICGQCQHQVECLEWAVNNEHFGIWGGTNEETRSYIRKTRRKREGKVA